MTSSAASDAISALAVVSDVAAFSVVATVSAVDAVPYSTLDSLRLGRSDINKNGELLGITILLLDEKDHVIHGFIRANWASHYRSSLASGSIVRLERFDVARVSQLDHKIALLKVSEIAIAIRKKAKRTGTAVISSPGGFTLLSSVSTT
ncbi:Uncharacterized protein Rs2_47572 [Raphanus sativus]|nr:Uncharacterized protein Rs2_47572 [Raphanus sativus]